MAKNFEVQLRGLKASRTRLQRIADAPRLNTAVHQRLVVAWREAGIAFIRAAVRSTLVQSGMSAATFFPLSRLIHERAGGQDAGIYVAARIREGRASAKDPRNYKTHPEFPLGIRTPGAQNPGLGDALATQRNAGQFTIGTPKRMFMQFSFFPSVWQFDTHEGRLSNALDAGFAAFKVAFAGKAKQIGETTLTDFIRSSKRKI